VAVVELKVTEHEPVVPVVQLRALRDPRFVEKETATPDTVLEVEAVIVDDWAVVMEAGLADTDREGVDVVEEGL
jgi:hypothetical protein